MLRWALLFLVLAIVAFVLGFALLTEIFATIAKIVFVLFLVLMVVAFVAGYRVAD